MVAYRRILAEHGIIQSMSRKGNCLDNAAMESFFGRLKTECFYGREFNSREEIVDVVGDYLDCYNYRPLTDSTKRTESDTISKTILFCIWIAEVIDRSQFWLRI